MSVVLWLAIFEARVSTKGEELLGGRGVDRGLADLFSRAHGEDAVGGTH